MFIGQNSIHFFLNSQHIHSKVKTFSKREEGEGFGGGGGVGIKENKQGTNYCKSSFIFVHNPTYEV